MIGVYDSGHGGLTVFKVLVERFGHKRFIYLGDHGNAPYGDRPHDEIVELTAAGVNTLFERGCSMVIMACNTATAIAGRQLQQEWLPHHWPDRKLLGIIAPTVEVATQTPWVVKEPLFPQKFNTDTIALFGTQATVESGVYETEIAKRCPHVKLVGQACPQLVPLIEQGAPADDIQHVVQGYVDELLDKAPHVPEWAVLGCTHYPLVAYAFRAALPPSTRLLDQPLAVANALDDYLERHPEFNEPMDGEPTYLTTGNPGTVTDVAAAFMQGIRFENVTTG